MCNHMRYVLIHVSLLVVSLLSSRYVKRNSAANLQSLIHLMKSVAYLSFFTREPILMIKQVNTTQDGFSGHFSCCCFLKQKLFAFCFYI